MIYIYKIITINKYLVIKKEDMFLFCINMKLKFI